MEKLSGEPIDDLNRYVGHDGYIANDGDEI